MIIYEPKQGMYDYKHMPGFAQFLLDNHLDAYVADQLRVWRALDLPILKKLEHMSEEQVVQLTKGSAADFLQLLANNQAREQLRITLDRWVKDQLNVMSKYEVRAEDITGVNFARAKALKQWSRHYPVSESEMDVLSEEINTFIFGSTTSALNTLIEIFKNKIEEESHFNKKMINASPGIIFIFDIKQNKEVYINGSVRDVMGYTAEEVLALGSNVLSRLTHPDDIPVLQKHFAGIQTERAEKARMVEYRFLHKDGTYRWLRTYDVVFRRNEAGEPIEVLGTTFEITRERQTALALQKRESQLLEAQTIAQIGSFEWDMVNDVSVFTPEVKNIFEWKEPPRKPAWLTNVHPDDVAGAENAFAEAKRTGTYNHQYRYLINGRQKFLWTRGVITFERGQPVSMRGTVQDITQLKQIESELLRKTVELERSNENLQQFASIASHDLKEPLRKMSMYTDMVMTLEEGKLTDHSSINLEKVKASAIRMQNMIEDILKFSTITKGERKQVVNLKSVVADALAILEEVVREKKVSVTTDELPDAAVIPSQMRQLFQNLFSNAIKFSRPGISPLIEVTHRFISLPERERPVGIDHAPLYLEIRVKDNGIGFKQEYAEKIFGLFARLHSRSVYEGSGLGLTICKRIAENHGGTIRAESAIGSGTSFFILLPASKKNPE
ncbi:MAG TPA: PAS domain-containing protein [Chryseosolibacter sp.]|nr:PAS domain-containing protein [Chryseosolibacter sp.]